MLGKVYRNSHRELDLTLRQCLRKKGTFQRARIYLFFRLCFDMWVLLRQSFLQRSEALTLHCSSPFSCHLVHFPQHQVILHTLNRHLRILYFRCLHFHQWLHCQNFKTLIRYLNFVLLPFTLLTLTFILQHALLLCSQFLASSCYSSTLTSYSSTTSYFYSSFSSFSSTFYSSP